MEELNIKLGMSVAEFMSNNETIGYIVISDNFNIYRILIPRNQSMFKIKNKELNIDTKNYFIVSFMDIGCRLTAIEEDVCDKSMRFFIEAMIDDIKEEPKNSDRKSISVHWPKEPDQNAYDDEDDEVTQPSDYPIGVQYERLYLSNKSKKSKED